MFIWDITRDDPSVLYRGRAADMLELDRLMRRMEKLTNDRRDLENQLRSANNELDTINERIEELQR